MIGMMSDTDELLQKLKPLFRSRRQYGLFLVINAFALLLFASYDSWFALPLIPSFVIIFFKYVLIESSLEENIWSAFQRYLIPAPGKKSFISYDKLRGVLGNLGDFQKYYVLAEGLYGNYYIRSLNCTVWFNTQSHYGSFERRYRVLEISTTQNFYHVFMDSKRNNQSQISTAMNVLSRSIRENTVLNVEGDVHKYFKIYTTNEGSEGLITLTPNTLIALRDYGSNFDVEFVENTVYLITRNKIKNIKDVLIYQRSVLDLLNTLGADLVRSRSDAKYSGKLSVKTPSILTF